MQKQFKINKPLVINNIKRVDLKSASFRNFILVVFVLLNVWGSISIREPGMYNITWEWRPAQTFMTSYWFEKEGIQLLHYQTPIYGPPWIIPFEFPLYQAASTLLSRVVGDLTFSSHLTSVISFYISALFLLLLCLEYFKSRLAAFIILTIYLWLPYNIHFSTEILIDYTSVAFALGFIYFLKKWLDNPRQWLLSALTIFCGCITALVKITTFPIVIFPAIFMSLQAMSRQNFSVMLLTRPREFIRHLFTHKLFWVGLAVAAILPLIASILWNWHSDKIKLAYPFTVWLASVNLTDWNYGTLVDKTSYTLWSSWLTVIYENFLFGGLIIFPVISIASIYQLSREKAEFLGSALLGTLLTIFIFFNLYRHDYYYITISAFMSILIGYGIYLCITFLLNKKRYWWFTILAIFLFFELMQGGEKFAAFQKAEAYGLANYQTKILPQALLVKQATPENGFVVSVQNDWYPEFLLATERKGLTFSIRERLIFNCQMLTDYNYTTVVGPADSPETIAALRCFKNQKLFAPGIYQVSN
jgi:hypothetical protein